MPPLSSLFMLYFVCKMAAVRCYTYQARPLFMSFAELAALEARQRSSKAGEHAVRCGKDGVEVVMKTNIFDTARFWRLGAGDDARCRASVSGRSEAWIIRAPLTECGGRVTVTEGAVRYNNMLLFSAPATHFHAEKAPIPVQCEYIRRYPVSSGALKPTWRPPDFHLRHMTSDWSSERKSSVYFPGQKVNIEASVNHPGPLRVYARSCVATLTPDVRSHPRYPFVDHRGCFADSQLNGPGSGFLPRVQNKLLRIQLEPFLFHGDPRRTIYVTCLLEAAPVSNRDPRRKACSFRSGRWASADGEDAACGGCQGSGHKRAARSEAQRGTTLGPLVFLLPEGSTRAK